MRIIKAFENIVDVKSDAMIYSTNTRLALTGGVGAALVKKFGPSIQIKLINQSQGMGMELAEIGDVFSVKTPEMPWHFLLHTVCTDGSYIASPEIVKHALIKALRICTSESTVKVISISELGTGYGTLTSEKFNEILSAVVTDNEFKGLKEIIVCKSGDRKQ